jgi:predicted histone-like DNA-binding protein
MTKMKTCMQELLAEGYKVKLDGIGTLYPKVTSKGVADAKDFSAQDDITRVGISFLADQSKKSLYKASATRSATSLSTQLYSELTGEDDGTANAPSGGGSSTGGNTGGSTGGSTGGNTGGDDDPNEN